MPIKEKNTLSEKNCASGTALWKHFWFRCIIYTVILVVTLLAVVYIRMEKILLPAPHTGKTTGNLKLVSGKAQLDAYWHRGKRDMPVILFCHGNGEYLQILKPFLREFIERHYSILAYDYAGYGGSTGTAGVKQSYSDAEAAYKFLTEHEKISASRIIIIGFSVGSGSACYLAEKYPIKALVLAAPFASAIQVLFPFSLPGDRYPNAERLKKRAVRLLLFHGKKDFIIPYRNSVKIYKSAMGEKKLMLIEKASHNDLFRHLGNCFWNELTLLNPKEDMPNGR